MNCRLPVLAAIAALAATPVLADGNEKISGILFGDYYYVASADDDVGTPEKRNAFQFRRVYFTYDRVVTDRFDIRIRLEANDKGFGSRDKMTPFVKHVYLKWKSVFGGDLYIGESGTPTWATSEKLWGYRSVERALLDLFKVGGSSADIGLGWKHSSGDLRYHLMVANGPGQRPENDNGKKFYGSLGIRPGDGVAEIYGDFDMRPGGRDEITLKAVLGMDTDGYRVGVEPFLRIIREASVAEPGEDSTLLGVSMFATLPVGPNHKLFGRVDAFNNEDATDLFLLAGVDFEIDKELSVIPNLHIMMPKAISSSESPDPVIQARVTGSFKF
ncbi:MAG: hypothetical protein VX733_12255 [Candidatus Latescibacterota bacterium]|nr:hypothetical protein [Candidatus Latescibacterota bacterium]